MTIRQAVHFLVSPDDARIAADPFFVPDRFDERLSFALGFIIFVIAVFVQYTFSSDPWAAGIFLFFGVFNIAKGFRRRNYRLDRLRRVAELHSARDGAIDGGWTAE